MAAGQKQASAQASRTNLAMPPVYCRPLALRYNLEAVDANSIASVLILAVSSPLFGYWTVQALAMSLGYGTR